MFEVGFSELLLIFALALIVLGPERLPRVAAQVGRWIGRARSIARQFREQLEEEINLEEQKSTRPKPAEPDTPAASAVAGEAASATDASDTSAAGQDTSSTPYANVGSPVYDDPAPEAAPATADVTASPPDASTDPTRAANERGI